MSIIDIMLGKLEDPGTRLENVKKAAVAALAEYAEGIIGEKASPETTWCIWGKDKGAFKDCYKGLIERINTGKVSGAFVKEIINKVHPYLEKLKRMPDAAKDSGEKLTEAHYAEFVSSADGDTGGYSGKFWKAFNEGDSFSMSADDIVAFLPPLIKRLGEWVNEKRGGNEDSLAGLEAAVAGADSTEEIELNEADPDLFTICKSWYKKDLTSKIKGRGSTNAADYMYETMQQETAEAVKAEYANVDAMLEFAEAERLDLRLQLDKFKERAKNTTGARDLANTIMGDIDKVVMNKAKEKIQPKLDLINSTFDAKAIAGSLGFPAGSAISVAASSEVMDELGTKLLTTSLKDIKSFNDSIVQVNTIFAEIEAKVQEKAKKIDDAKEKLNALQEKIREFPADLQETLKTLTNDLANASKEDDVEGFLKKLDEAINKYYDAKNTAE